MKHCAPLALLLVVLYTMAVDCQRWQRQDAVHDVWKGRRNSWSHRGQGDRDRHDGDWARSEEDHWDDDRVDWMDDQYDEDYNGETGVTDGWRHSSGNGRHVNRNGHRLATNTRNNGRNIGRNNGRNGNWDRHNKNRDNVGRNTNGRFGSNQGRGGNNRHSSGGSSQWNSDGHDAGTGQRYKGPGRNGGDFVPRRRMSGRFKGKQGRGFSMTDGEREEFFHTMRRGDHYEVKELRGENPEIFDILSEGDEEEREELIEYLGGDVDEVGGTDPLDIMSWMGGGMDVSSWDILGIFSKSENTGGTSIADRNSGGLLGNFGNLIKGAGDLTSILDIFKGRK